jgi:hypothetical protein
LANILILELISGILCVLVVSILINNGRVFGFYGAVFLVYLIMLLFGQRLAKDDGARTLSFILSRDTSCVLVELNSLS